MRCFFVFVCLFGVLSCLPDRFQLSLNEFLRLRCSLNPIEEVLTSWKGSAYLHLYQEQPRRLFDIVGMNIARCLVDRGNRQVILTSRETQLYLDPSTGKKLNRWFNPWINQSVSVIHVANDPVQNLISMDGFTADAFLLNENQVSYPVDVNLFYPNPLYSNETLRFYSKEQFYQAGEYFKFFTRLSELRNTGLSQVSELDFSWTRVAPVLPWMNLSQSTNGSLIFSAQGSKVSCLSSLDPILFAEINERIPIYEHAPNCQLKTSSETSWTYFKKYFQDYLQQTTEFPIPKSTEDIPCV